MAVLISKRTISMITDTFRTYSELSQITDYMSRFRYLKLDGRVSEETFGFDRYLNQRFYHSAEWRNVRNHVITRDLGMDMGLDGYPIRGHIYIHHMNPMEKEDILGSRGSIFDPEFLICVSSETHNAIHYGDEKLLATNEFIERTPNDTSPWRLG